MQQAATAGVKVSANPSNYYEHVDVAHFCLQVRGGLAPAASAVGAGARRWCARVRVLRRGHHIIGFRPLPTPSTLDGNWQWQLENTDFSDAMTGKLKNLTLLSSRR